MSHEAYRNAAIAIACIWLVAWTYMVARHWL
jgi:hypothetical protein